MTSQEFQKLTAGTTVRNATTGKLYVVHNPKMGFVLAMKNGKPWGRIWPVRDYAALTISISST